MNYFHQQENNIYHIQVFDTETSKQEIFVEDGKNYYYLAIVMGASELDIQIRSTWTNSCIYGNCLTIASAGHTSKVNMQATLAHDHSAAHLHMVTMLLEWSDATVHGGVTIVPGIIKVEGRLLEENIVLGKKVKIHTLPQLDVRSNDVAASHGARIETLDPKKLFYLQSKGISEQESKRLMIEGFVETMLSIMQDDKCKIQDWVIEELKRGVMERVLRD